MTKVSKNKPILSAIILNYNAGNYLSQCLSSIDQSQLTDQIEIIIADNASTDDSFTKSQKLKLVNPNIKYIFKKNTGNVGFSTGNNQGLTVSNPNSKYVLFLNPDTSVEPNTLQGMINYLEKNSYINAATCYITLVTTGKLQPECHRNFPTPLNSFLHFSGISSRSYFMEYLDYSKIQKINCCVGAFFMMKRTVGNKVGWWNEKYFMYGEDLDICYKLKKAGFQLYFVPDFKINHYQGVSSGIKKSKSAASRETKIRSAIATTNAMKIFYQENLIDDYPKVIQPVIYLGIKFLEISRVFKAKYL